MWTFGKCCLCHCYLLINSIVLQGYCMPLLSQNDKRKTLARFCEFVGIDPPLSPRSELSLLPLLFCGIQKFSSGYLHIGWICHVSRSQWGAHLQGWKRLFHIIHPVMYMAPQDKAKFTEWSPFSVSLNEKQIYLFYTIL